MSRGEAVQFNQVCSYCCYLSNKQTDSLYMSVRDQRDRISLPNHQWKWYVDTSLWPIIEWDQNMNYIMLNTLYDEYEYFGSISKNKFET